MRRKISYILLALIIICVSLVGCMFLAVHHYEATVVAEEREHEHENKINKLAKNRDAHMNYVKELNEELDTSTDDKETSNSDVDVIDAIIEQYGQTNYAAFFEESAPCGHPIGLTDRLKDRFISGYEYMCRYIRRYILR